MSFDELWGAAPAAAPVQAQAWNMNAMNASLPQQQPPRPAEFNLFAPQPSVAYHTPAPTPAAAAPVNPFAELEAEQSRPNATAHANPYGAPPVAAASSAASVDPFQMFFGLSQGVSAAAPPPQVQAQPQQPRPAASALASDMFHVLSGGLEGAPGGGAKAKSSPAPNVAQPPKPLMMPTPRSSLASTSNAAVADGDQIASPHADADFDALFASAAQTPVAVALLPAAGSGRPAISTANHSESSFSTFGSGAAAAPASLKRSGSSKVTSPTPKSNVTSPAAIDTSDGAAAASVISPRSRKPNAGGAAGLASPKGAIDFNSFKALAAASPKGEAKAPAADVVPAKAASSKKKSSSTATATAPAIEAFTTRRIQRLQTSGFEYVISPMGTELEHDEVVNDSGSQSFARNVEKVFCRADIWEAPNGQFDVKGEWFADGHTVSVAGTLTEMTPDGQLLGFVQFTFPRGTNFKLRNRWITFNAPIIQWPPGNYHLKVSFGTLHTERVDFSIRPDSD